jgi:ABC-2 type transport system permease protein
MNAFVVKKSLSAPSWSSQFRVMKAIARKDWLHFTRYPLDAISNVVQPLVFLTPIYFMGLAFSVNGEARGFAAYSGTTDYMSFIILGTALTNFIMAVFWGMGYSIKNDMDTGVLENNWLCPVSRPLLIISRSIASLFITTLTSLVTILVAWLVFGFRPTGNALAAALTILPLLLGLYGFGLAFASLVMLLREANTLVDVSSFLVQTFSGANFPVNSLPRWLLPLSLALPITYGFDAVRGWLLHTRTLLPISVEIILMVIFMFLMIWLGLWAFKALERRVRSLGTIGQH